MSALLVMLLVFAAGTLSASGVLRIFAQRDRIRRRYGMLSVDPGSISGLARTERRGLDPARLGLDAEAQRRLRDVLIRAGYFGETAVTTFTLLRLLLLVLLPLGGLGVGAAVLPIFGATEKAALTGVLLAIAYYAPQAWLSRQRRSLEARYKLTFPDFLDMLVVCINAGLSLEAALQRTAGELRRADDAFRRNLDQMAVEMRAGKSTGDALRALADRLSIREAAAFAGLLQQTLELGTDVTHALTVFADEMRDRRVSLAEEKAAALPPKLTLPLGLLIFPVVLIVVLAPAVLRIAHVVTR